MKLRLVTLEDVGALVELRMKFLREMGMEKGRSSEERREMAKKTAQFFSDTISKGSFLSWVVEVEGRIVATSGLVFMQKPPVYGNASGREAYIMNMYTLPEYRRKGYGTLLMKEMLEYLKSSGIERASLHYTRDGLPLYEKFGFKPYPFEMRLQLKEI